MAFESFTVVSSDLANKAEEILSHHMDTESISDLLISNKLITKEDLDVANGAPCQYMKNSSLLEQIDLMNVSILRQFADLLQQCTNENNKVIGKVLLKRKNLLCMCNTLLCSFEAEICNAYSAESLLQSIRKVSQSIGIIKGGYLYLQIF